MGFPKNVSPAWVSESSNIKWLDPVSQISQWIDQPSDNLMADESEKREEAESDSRPRCMLIFILIFCCIVLPTTIIVVRLMNFKMQVAFVCVPDKITTKEAPPSRVGYEFEFVSEFRFLLCLWNSVLLNVIYSPLSRKGHSTLKMGEGDNTNNTLCTIILVIVLVCVLIPAVIMGVLLVINEQVLCCCGVCAVHNEVRKANMYGAAAIETHQHVRDNIIPHRVWSNSRTGTSIPSSTRRRRRKL